MALFFDVTKAVGSRQLSGLMRVSEKLRNALELELQRDLVPVVWHSGKACLLEAATGKPVILSAADVFLTPEVFSFSERKGILPFLEQSLTRNAAVFHDAIPYRHPEITWPKSVKRHPEYMAGLAQYDHVFCVSGESRKDLESYWSHLGITQLPPLSVLSLGADFFDRSSNPWQHRPQTLPLVLNIGIIEPRKNQTELLECARRLWETGLEFELHFVGRINPHFGKPIEKQIKRAGKAGHPVYLHAKQSDRSLLDLYSRAHFTVFASIAEGFGLPVVESLWLGIPCITRSLPSLESFVDGLSCVSYDSPPGLDAAMNRWLTDGDTLGRATLAAQNRALPTWSQAARELIKWMNAER